MNLYPWQSDCLRYVTNANAVISAPTGSGKTIVAYQWSDIFSKKNSTQKVIFTAPIKALSNERYRDLRNRGLEVGIETGDVKQNTDAPILCVTQEIYTLKYAPIPHQKVIIDEFHYVAQNPDRSRAYIDGFRRAHPSTKFLVMSATFGNPGSVKEYLEEVTGKPFVLYHTDYRPTKLQFLDEMLPLSKIADLNSLIFVFSIRGCISIAGELAYYKRPLKNSKLKQVEDLAASYKVNLDRLPWVQNGVGVYHGSLLPKEKLFTEELFRNGLIQQVVGTDALALGVNLPAEYVVFAQLAKYYDGPISKNEFLQMAGRAGRKGYYDTGYVSYFPSRFESFAYNTDDLYFSLLEKPQEPFTIQLTPDYKALIRGETDVEAEAELISRYSIPQLNEEVVEYQLGAVMNNIRKSVKNLSKEFKIPVTDLTELLGDLWFSEFEIEDNLDLLEEFATAMSERRLITIEDLIGTPPDADSANGRDLNLLLQLRKWHNQLPKYLRDWTEPDFATKLNSMIRKIDHTAI